ncbi:MAG TPA: hypothetical protein VD993_19180 [Chitinophagaceae bacterium]|nr:hypothetical protein [Chitinophagaceae bacterium]
MQSNKKGVVIAAATVLLAAFFMPWIKYIVGVSAWDLIFGQASPLIDNPVKYLLVLVPVSAGIIAYNAAFNNENYPISKGLLFSAPILSIVIVYVIILLQIDESGGSISGSAFEGLGSVLGIGFWLTLIAAVILPFMRSQPQNVAPITTTTADTAVGNTTPGNLAPTNKTTALSQKQIGIGLVIIGVLSMILSTQDQFFTQKRTTSEEIYSIFMDNYSSNPRINKEAKQIVLFSGLAATLLGGFLLYKEWKTIKPETSTSIAAVDENESTASSTKASR